MLARLFIGRTEEGEHYFSWLGSLLLLAPSLWIGAEVLTLGNTSELVNGFRLGMTLLTLGVALPYIAYVILNTALPEIAEIQHPRLVMGLVVIGVFTGVLAFVVGAKNYYVMSCYDFQVAGTSLPENCYRGESVPPISGQKFD